MLDDLGLVHMNGRIYDPVLGPMLTADVLVQSPNDLQSYNRYSYVGNNPLSRTDPTGFYFESGHFYATYIAARIAGLDDNRAYTIAYFSQYPDQHKETTAFWGVGHWVLQMIFNHKEFIQTQKGPHALTGFSGSAVDGVRKHLGAEVAKKNITDEQRGMAAHPFEDSRPHTKEHGDGSIVAFVVPFGHALENML